MSRALSARSAKSALRALTLPPTNSIDFSSNDSLSLSTSPTLKDAFFQELRHLSTNPDTKNHFRLGSTGSRLLDGNSAYAEDLEASIARFHGAESGLLFNSGWDANVGFFASVPQAGDIVLHDEFIHASAREGLRLSRARKSISFAHNCVADLRRRLEEIKALDGVGKEVREGKRSVFVAVESLYSMDGDLAPLREIVEIVESALPKGNGHVIVDEAHSTGIYGDRGRGVVCALGLEKRVFARLHTFGKALGCNGCNSLFSRVSNFSTVIFWKLWMLMENHIAMILCDDLTRSYLINYARPLIYTTFMSYPSLAAIKASYSLLMTGKTESVRRSHSPFSPLALSHHDSFSYPPTSNPL
jgi:8-amino-7-oxononanoate synthase